MLEPPSHHPSRCSIHGSQVCHLPPSHLSHQPIGLPTTMCVLTHPLATIQPDHHSPGPQTCHLPPHHTPDPLTHRCQTTKSHRPPGARVMATRPTRHQTNCHPNTRVTWSHGHRPATNHQIHRCQGAKTTTKILDYQTPSPLTHPTTEATNPPDHRSHRCQWCLSHHPPRTSDPPEPPTTKPIWIGQTHPTTISMVLKPQSQLSHRPPRWQSHRCQPHQPTNPPTSRCQNLQVPEPLTHQLYRPTRPPEPPTTTRVFGSPTHQSHHPPDSQGHGSQDCHLLPSHFTTEPPAH